MNKEPPLKEAKKLYVRTCLLCVSCTPDKWPHL